MALEVAGTWPTVTSHGAGPRPAGSPEALPTAAGRVGPSGGDLAPGPVTGPRLGPSLRELGLIGDDPAWRQVVELAATIAPSRGPVLVAGEPGTGKSQLARLIHGLGTAPDRPFLTCQAAALAKELSAGESEEPGRAVAAPSPPPANPARIWAAEIDRARGCTLHIDDVAALPVALQLLLLRDLQSRDYGAAAGDSSPAGEVRYILSTGEHLPDLIEQGRFHQELYHRISVIVLTPPPLRHRGTDVELLAEWFRDRYAQEFHKAVIGLQPRRPRHPPAPRLAGQRPRARGRHPTGRRDVQRAADLLEPPGPDPQPSSPEPRRRRPPRPDLSMGICPLKEALGEPEKRIIIQALRAFNGNRQETAQVLDINRTTLYKKMKKYGLLIDEAM